MTGLRFVLAQGLAIVASILVLLKASNGFSIFAISGLDMILGLSIIIFSTAAFFVSWKERSILISALLIMNGVLYMIPAVIATGYFKFITIPGPIIGVFFGSWMLALGIAKSVRTKMVIQL